MKKLVNYFLSFLMMISLVVPFIPYDVYAMQTTYTYAFIDETELSVRSCPSTNTDVCPRLKDCDGDTIWLWRPRVVEVIGIDKAGGIRLISGEDLVAELAPFHIDAEGPVGLEERRVLKIRQFAEHGAVPHVVTVDQRVLIGKIRRVVAVHKDTAVSARRTVIGRFQVLIVVRTANDGITDCRIVNHEPTNDFGIHRFQRGEIDGKAGIILFRSDIGFFRLGIEAAGLMIAPGDEKNLSGAE